MSHARDALVPDWQSRFVIPTDIRHVFALA